MNYYCRYFEDHAPSSPWLKIAKGEQICSEGAAQLSDDDDIVEGDRKA